MNCCLEPIIDILCCCKPYKCNICSKRFCCKTELGIHIKKQHEFIFSVITDDIFIKDIKNNNKNNLTTLNSMV